MQFNRDEYLLLSRRGSVPPALRSGPRPRPEWQPETQPSRGRSLEARSRGAVRTKASRPVEGVLALRSGLRATWTAFGSGGQDQFGR